MNNNSSLFNYRCTQKWLGKYVFMKLAPREGIKEAQRKWRKRDTHSSDLLGYEITLILLFLK